MEVGSGREVEVPVTEAVDNEGRRHAVERLVVTNPMTDDGARRRGAHDHRDSRAQTRLSGETTAKP
jgi:hypothetical protein